jgi:Ser/Thr protein kinase RdoA (MazF antagonist)
VLKDSLNLLVWLRPSPVVARIQVRTGLVRSPDAAADSLALARFLVGAGLPISPPVDDVDPGPHAGVTGRTMTLWTWLDIDDAAPDPAEVGRTLRGLHEAMAAYDGPLRHVGPLDEIGRLVDVLATHSPKDAARIAELRARLVLPDLPVQAVHGDAHHGNVVMTAAGVRWIDWEESWRGPVAWDIACLEHRQATFGGFERETRDAVAAYGPIDADAVRAWLPVVALWAAAWGLVGGLERPDWTVAARRRIAWVASRLEG